MGAYDGNPTSEIAYSRDSRSQWGNSNPPIDGAIDSLVDRFSGIGVSGNDPSKESLFQVMNAVEAAENMIKNQTAGKIDGRSAAVGWFCSSNGGVLEHGTCTMIRPDEWYGGTLDHQMASLFCAGIF